jgi:GNAT superfamily N-acetyltransferase
MKTCDRDADLTYSYLALRKAVGWIGIALPLVLVLGMLLIFREKPVLKTISLYYHSGMRDVFVGAICSIALFLFFYKGYDRLDNWAGNVAGFFAVGIALFPTAAKGPQDWVGVVHFISAAVFFMILSGISMFLFTRTKPDPTRQKVTRNKIYLICGLVMIFSLVSILIYFSFFDFEKSASCFVFWAETIALIAFGVSWLTKGGTLYPDKKNQVIIIRNAVPAEFEEIGKLMVRVYSQLEGFPKETEQPDYYRMLANVGEITEKPESELLVAISSEDKIAGAVVFFGDMKYYGSGGIATSVRNASGFRLLAVDPLYRRQGIGTLLTKECIRKAKNKKAGQVIIHTTLSMQTAWNMYLNMGFKRSEDLDFMQGELLVLGFRYILD